MKGYIRALFYVISFISSFDSGKKSISITRSRFIEAVFTERKKIISTFINYYN